ncbi:MAG: EAL domain-containing protein [Burkholderiales bacterium]|nr:MAG: EAL domain-containing protein [Burkholderiales bacterium]
MSLIRQIRLLLLAALVLALLASTGVSIETTRGTLQKQLRLKNNDNAQSLALELSHQKGDRGRMELVLAAQFDTGFYRRIRFVPDDGVGGFARESEAPAAQAPRWFKVIVPIESVPGVGQVSDGSRALGSVEVVSHTSHADDALWEAALSIAGLLALIGAAVAIGAAFVVRSLRQPLDDTVAQANALVEGRFERVTEPAMLELQPVARAMNTMVERVQSMFNAQSRQVEQLRVQAQCDSLTGLAHRRQFMAQLASALGREDGPIDGGLVLLRVCDLAGLNRAIGHEATDRLLQSVADVLRAYPDRGGGCFVGRLNGSDFALGLPVPGVAAESAQSLAQALSAALTSFGLPVSVALGAVEIRPGATASALLAAVDAALARSETSGPFTVEVADPPVAGEPLRGESAWRQEILDALAQGRCKLVEFVVIDRQRRLLHLECPMRLQLRTDGPFEMAGRWLPLAVRNRLTPAVDEQAVRLALAAIAADGRPRCINVARTSIGDSGFGARVRAAMQDSPREARLLSVEIPEGAAVDHFDWLQELGRQLRPEGVRVGLEHAGTQLARIDRLYEAGLDYVKLDAAVVNGIASDPNRAGHVAGIVAMLHGLALRVIAEGVIDEQDALALWDCHLDGITGPWATAQPLNQA